jgi:predicted extracellular nuclease
MRGKVAPGVTVFVAAASTAGVMVITPVSAAAAEPSNALVVNEVYGGGGNSGATYSHDFVELANRGHSAVSVDGWSVQYHSRSSTGSWQVTKLSGKIAPGKLYLVQEAKGSGGSKPLPNPDATGTIPMAASSGTVGLVHGTGALTCDSSQACSADTVDLVGYGNAAISEAKPAAAGSNTKSVQRSDSADSDDNAADFAAAAPTPGADNESGTGSGTPGKLRIHDIQGHRWLSPRKGKKVTNVPGVVTGVRTQGSSRGYWIQSRHPDHRRSTSEGIFVFTSSPTVAVGDKVLVSGTVKEYYPLGEDETTKTTSNLSTTEIDQSSMTVLQHNVSLPKPVVVTPNTVPYRHAPNLHGGNIEHTRIRPWRSALDFWESVEGMRVEVNNARVVGPSNDYGEQYVTTKPHQDRTYRGGTQLRAENAEPSGRVKVVAVNGSNPGVDVGDVFAGATIGPVDWSEYGGYTINATKLGSVNHHKLPPGTATRQSRSQLATATYNVENLAPDDPESKFRRLAKGITQHLARPDIIALEEVQDNSGATDNGVTAANKTLRKLSDAVVAQGGPRYHWREVEPVNDQDGGQPGGNIRSAFLFNPKRVSFLDHGGDRVNRSTTATRVVRRHGSASVTLSPGRIKPKNSAWTDSRKPLVGVFRFRHHKVTVVANHFDSKLGDQNAEGRFQYPKQSSARQRAKQARLVHHFVAKMRRADRHANVVVLGDLNDYQFSPALRILKTGHAWGHRRPILTDLINRLPVNQRYTYVYNGISQALDHILITGSTRRAQYQVVHVNAEYHNQVSDHDPQVLRLRFGHRHHRWGHGHGWRRRHGRSLGR